MSHFLQTLFLCHYLSLCISTPIEWHPWINLPIANTKVLATTYEHSIVVIGGTQQTSTVYKLNASATIHSPQTWQTVAIKSPPGEIQILNDNYLTNGRYTFIFGPSLDSKNTIYTYDLEINQFVPPTLPLPDTQAAHPCAVHSHGFLFLIGGVTYQNSETNVIDCLSTTQAFNFDSKQWQTFSSHMPWDSSTSEAKGACYNLCQSYNGYLFLFGGVTGGYYPTYLTHIYTFDIRNGPQYGMQWHRANNVSIEKGIVNTHSLMVSDTIYMFSSGVQSLQLSDAHKNLKINFMSNDGLTPERCQSGNVYHSRTNHIYAIGGSDCKDLSKLYFEAQISQNMTVQHSGGKHYWWDRFNFQDWIYFVIGFICAIMFVCVWVYCCKSQSNTSGERNAKEDRLIKGHLQDSSGHRTGFSREGSDVISTLSERPQVDI